MGPRLNEPACYAGYVRPMRNAGLIVLLLAALPLVTAQAQTSGSLSGIIRSEEGSLLAGVRVTVISTDTMSGTETDAAGAFRFVSLPTGIYTIQASLSNHQSVELSETWVRAGKEEVVELRMERSATQLGEFEVQASLPGRLDAVGTDRLTVERSLRYPATFFDPARVAMSYAGVASVNDQANHMSVRGNDPGSNAWLLEGAEIVTPNHLTNAGTPSDLPTLTGGGTTMLSAQMLAPSRLMTGSLASPYGNALGGIMDLRLRRGSRERQAFTVQAGLLGIDLSTEGPFASGGKASYLINYRYSTLGLLSALGVALGDEAITFQDLALTVSLPITDRTELMLFGMGGMSANVFNAKDSTDWEFDKDSQDIDYAARMGAGGLSLRQRIGKNAMWTTTVAVSANDQQRTEVYSLATDREAAATRNGLRESKASLFTEVRMSLGPRTSARVGAQAMQRLVRKELLWIRESAEGLLMRPFAHAGHSFSERVRVDAGIAYAGWTANGSAALEPRLSLQVAPGRNGRFILATGQRSQVPRLQNYALRTERNGDDGPLVIDNSGVGLTRSFDVDVRYEHLIRPHVHGSISLFRQQLLDLPAQPGYNLLNEWDGVFAMTLTNQGEALNQGGSIALERDMVGGYYYLVNATFFRSQCGYGDADEHESRWSTQYIVNAVIGKEFAKQKELLKRIWGVNVRVSGSGGQRYTPLPVPADPSPEAYSARYGDVFRVDMRVYLKRERAGRSGMWSLDLLNATNALNESYRYFDSRKGELVTKYQLGLIPNVSYRIEF